MISVRAELIAGDEAAVRHRGEARYYWRVDFEARDLAAGAPRRSRIQAAPSGSRARVALPAMEREVGAARPPGRHPDASSGSAAPSETSSPSLDAFTPPRVNPDETSRRRRASSNSSRAVGDRAGRRARRRRAPTPRRRRPHQRRKAIERHAEIQTRLLCSRNGRWHAPTVWGVGRSGSSAATRPTSTAIPSE